MASNGKITQDQISVQDPFGLLRDSADKTNTVLRETIAYLELTLPITEKMLSGLGSSMADIEKKIKAMDVLSQKTKEIQSLQKDQMNQDIALEKIRAAKAMADGRELTNTIKKTKETERLINAQARETAQGQKLIQKEERLKNAYYQTQAAMTAIGDRLRHLATQQAMGVKLKTEEIIELKKLSVENNKYHAALVKVDAMMGRHQRQVGNYALQWNGLTHSINQLTREAPAFANSMQTGFMALSNNIPMLFDELGALSRKNKELLKDGEKSESMWKTVGKSVFSFQTLLSLGVTLLTVYGAKLVTWIGEMTKASSVSREFAENQKQLAKNQKETSEYVAKEATGLLSLISRIKATNVESKERIDLINKANDQYGTTLKNIQDETLFQGMLNEEVSKYLLFKEYEFKIKKNEIYINDILEKKLKAEQLLYKQKEKTKELDVQIAKEQKKYGADDLNLSATNQKLNDLKRARTLAQSDINITVGALNQYDGQLEKFDFRIQDLSRYISDLGYSFDKNTNKVKDNTKALKKNFDEFIKYRDAKLAEQPSPGEENNDILLANQRGIVYEKELNKIYADRTKNQVKQKQADKELIKAKQKLLELEYKLAIIGKSKQEIISLQKKLDLDIENLNAKQIEEEVDAIKKKGEALKDVAKLSKEVSNIVTEYFSGKLTNEIELLDNYLAIVNKNYDYLADKAAQGNLQAEESLKAQLKLQKELKDEKYKAQQNLAKIQAITAIAGGIGSLAGSIQGFATGTESEIGNYVKPNLSGVGIDNTLVRVHGKERIINGELSKAITGHKTSEVVKGFLNYKQMANGQVGYSVDLSETNRLLKEVASKSVPNWELGEIGQGFMDVVKREVNGNKETVHIYRNKYR